MLALGCGEAMTEPEPDAGPEDPPTLETDAVVTFATVYESGQYEPGFGAPGRDFIPMDLSAAPTGELWVVQRVQRDDRFDDETECTQAAQTGAANDCAYLTGGTVAITDPGASEAATEDNGRAKVVVDYNAWHFMRRPSSIAFGATEVRIEPGHPGALDPNTGESIIDEPMVLTNTFATCHEHGTGNFTDQAPFIGPTLWTSDPEIYNGTNGSESWSNGSHLDMVHATQYCMGIAYDSEAEEDSVYWVFNGQEGAIDRYDFGAPHVPGHYDHDDARVKRYAFFDDPLVRVPNVPSNLEVAGDSLFIADTGNGRVVRLDRTNEGTVGGHFRTFENLSAEVVDDVPLETVIGKDELEALWGSDVEPSGLAMLDDETLIVANHASGHLTILRTDGEVLRTIDTETGEGIGGIAVLDGVVYFVQMRERRIYRLDVDETMRVSP